MVPIYDTDIEQARGTQEKGEWRNFELWEKTEQKNFKRKRLWIILTAVVFVLLSAVPSLLDRLPKWESLLAIRKLAHEISEMKEQVGLTHFAHEIRFGGNGALSFRIEKKFRCTDSESQLVKEGFLLEGNAARAVALLSAEDGQKLDVPGLVESFCYDPLTGVQFKEAERKTVGFGILPVKDLTETRIDRLSILLLSGESAEISFN